MKTMMLLPLAGLAMLLIAGCGSMNFATIEQEEELSQSMAAPNRYSVNSRWETGNWDYDYSSE
ncbi:MAG TPA: hypothetical protein VIB79_03030 [Candidatus Binatia bacterium]|jgi:hypothetical protein